MGRDIFFYKHHSSFCILLKISHNGLASKLFLVIYQLKTPLGFSSILLEANS